MVERDGIGEDILIIAHVFLSDLQYFLHCER